VGELLSRSRLLVLVLSGVGCWVSCAGKDPASKKTPRSAEKSKLFVNLMLQRMVDFSCATTDRFEPGLNQGWWAETTTSAIMVLIDGHSD